MGMINSLVKLLKRVTCKMNCCYQSSCMLDPELNNNAVVI